MNDDADLNIANEDIANDPYPWSYWHIEDADEIVLDGHFTYDTLKAILVKWEQYREREQGGAMNEPHRPVVLWHGVYDDDGNYYDLMTEEGRAAELAARDPEWHAKVDALYGEAIARVADMASAGDYLERIIDSLSPDAHAVGDRFAVVGCGDADGLYVVTAIKDGKVSLERTGQ